jgi:hypothetical protein
MIGGVTTCQEQKIWTSFSQVWMGKKIEHQKHQPVTIMQLGGSQPSLSICTIINYNYLVL